MKPYLITIGALSYTALARSSCAALCDALAHHGLAGISVQGTVLRAELADQQPSALLRELVLADVTVDSFTTQGQTLEEVFVGLTGEGFDVD